MSVTVLGERIIRVRLARQGRVIYNMPVYGSVANLFIANAAGTLSLYVDTEIARPLDFALGADEGTTTRLAARR
jgi:hypothetical protein